MVQKLPPGKTYYSIMSPGQITTTSYTRGIWNTNLAELLTFFTSSTQSTDSQEYYYEVWGSASLSCTDDNMFSVTYGHVSGSGSINEGGNLDDTATRAIYSQYKLTCLDGDEGGIILKGETTPIEDFYAVNINREKYGDKLDPGNFEINIAALSGSGKVNAEHTGSKVQISGSNPIVITLIDDSDDQNDNAEESRYFSIARNLVSGSLQDGIYKDGSNNRHYYGKVYPSQGVIIISAHSLDQSASFNTVTGSNINGDNSYKLFTAISGAASVKSMGFTARAIDIKNEEYYYVRVPINDANYTSNPTFVNQEEGTNKGKIKNIKFVDNPKTFISTIGLYNEEKELLAVAKMSKPLKKTSKDELSITIKLEY